MDYMKKERRFRHEFASADALRGAIAAASDAMLDAFPNSAFRDAAVLGPNGTGKSETGDLQDALIVAGDDASSGWFVVRQDLGKPTHLDSRLAFTIGDDVVVTGWVTGADDEWVTGLADQLELIFATHDA